MTHESRGAIEINYAKKLVEYLKNVAGMPIHLDDESVYTKFWYAAQISLYYAVSFAHQQSSADILGGGIFNWIPHQLEKEDTVAELLSQTQRWWDAANVYRKEWLASGEPWSTVAYLAPNPFLTTALIMATTDKKAWDSTVHTFDASSTLRSIETYLAAEQLWKAMKQAGWDKPSDNPCSSSENNAGYGSLAALCWRQINGDSHAIEEAWTASCNLLRGALSLSGPETLIHVECKGNNCEYGGYFQVWNRGCPGSGYLTPNYAGDAAGLLNYAILARGGKWYPSEFGSVYKWWGWSGSTIDVGVVKLNQESYVREACAPVFNLPADRFPTVETCCGSRCSRKMSIVVDEWGTPMPDKQSYALAFQYWRALNRFGTEHEQTQLVSAHYDMICALMQYRTRLDQVVAPYHMPGTSVDWHRLIVSCSIAWHTLAAAVNYGLCQ